MKVKNLFCVKSLKFAIPHNKLEYAYFMLPFELLFRDVKSNDLSIPQTKTLKSKKLDTTFPSFDSFNNSEQKSYIFKVCHFAKLTPVSNVFSTIK